MKKTSVFYLFFSGFLMVFLLLFLGTLLYSSLGYMFGWNSFDFKLMGIELIYADIDQEGFSLGTGPALIILSFICGIFNVLLTKVFKKRFIA
ncbi:hypothetical protein [Bacillus sp. FJAT-27251]|uniref:hypothetical protein n=1 Tax=Bacillus sp. FJAT-27251 TaxID=1684142 RepID=UPI0006A7B497|nr:hypothetical protein [Bacillus sp. FJAT-27251]